MVDNRSLKLRQKTKTFLLKRLTFDFLCVSVVLFFFDCYVWLSHHGVSLQFFTPLNLLHRGSRSLWELFLARHVWDHAVIFCVRYFHFSYLQARCTTSKSPNAIGTVDFLLMTKLASAVWNAAKRHRCKKKKRKTEKWQERESAKLGDANRLVDKSSRSTYDSRQKKNEMFLFLFSQILM